MVKLKSDVSLSREYISLRGSPSSGICVNTQAKELLIKFKLNNIFFNDDDKLSFFNRGRLYIPILYRPLCSNVWYFYRLAENNKFGIDTKKRFLNLRVKNGHNILDTIAFIKLCGEVSL